MADPHWTADARRAFCERVLAVSKAATLAAMNELCHSMPGDEIVKRLHKLHGLPLHDDVVSLWRQSTPVPTVVSVDMPTSSRSHVQLLAYVRAPLLTALPSGICNIDPAVSRMVWRSVEPRGYRRGLEDTMPMPDFGYSSALARVTIPFDHLFPPPLDRQIARLAAYMHGIVAFTHLAAAEAQSHEAVARAFPVLHELVMDSDPDARTLDLNNSRGVRAPLTAALPTNLAAGVPLAAFNHVLKYAAKAGSDTMPLPKFDTTHAVGVLELRVKSK